MIFIVAGILLGAYLAGVRFSPDTLLVVGVVVLYGEVVNWRLTKAERREKPNA